MKTFEKIIDLKAEINTAKQQGKKVGFVPTMGALHSGHVSLIKKAKSESDLVVCSIFVNPIQFNDTSDLEKYPRTLEADIQKLKDAGCDIVFVPSVEEMYPEAAQEKYSFGELEEVMEGPSRPGHFNGVAVVVKRLFDITEPHKAFFGEKDFQQLAIIRRLVEDQKMPIEIVGCPIVREHDGLAMSSRNVRLTQQERQLAPTIHKILSEAKERSKEIDQTKNIKDEVMARFCSIPEFRMEYFEIVDDKTLQPIDFISETNGVVGCIAIWLGSVRLIDVIRFK
ncbi:pantoate--beta-alanine ligase [Bacteroidales bacterium OttesenSCG-928-C19]|nr:pantoate--beta-alanine ligase [Bacteroidales bacterium OttesenSCG-928-C19]